MKKKYYIQPQQNVIQMHTAQVLATSLRTDISISDDEASVGGEGDDALTNHRDGWDASNWEE